MHLDEIVRPVYIREAYRLLQQSIIFVESEDIELDDENLTEVGRTSSTDFDFLEMEEAPVVVPESTSALSDSPESAPLPSEKLQETARESFLSRELSTHSEAPQSIEPPALENDEEPPLKKVRKEKKPKGKTLLSAELYRSMTAMIGLILKAKQEQAEAEGDGKGGDYGGCRWGDLVTAYLSQVGVNSTLDHDSSCPSDTK